MVTSPLALIFGILEWWQILAILLLVGLIIFWVQYRKRNM